MHLLPLTYEWNYCLICCTSWWPAFNLTGHKEEHVRRRMGREAQGWNRTFVTGGLVLQLVLSPWQCQDHWSLFLPRRLQVLFSSLPLSSLSLTFTAERNLCAIVVAPAASDEKNQPSFESSVLPCKRWPRVYRPQQQCTVACLPRFKLEEPKTRRQLYAVASITVSLPEFIIVMIAVWECLSETSRVSASVMQMTQFSTLCHTHSHSVLCHISCLLQERAKCVLTFRFRCLQVGLRVTSCQLQLVTAAALVLQMVLAILPFVFICKELSLWTHMYTPWAQRVCSHLILLSWPLHWTWEGVSSAEKWMFASCLWCKSDVCSLSATGFCVIWLTLKSLIIAFSIRCALGIA